MTDIMNSDYLPVPPLDINYLLRMITAFSSANSKGDTLITFEIYLWPFSSTPQPLRCLVCCTCVAECG